MTPDRRSLFTSAGLAALAVGTSSLAGCASGSRSPSGNAPQATTTLEIEASSIPVGGGRILDNANYVITQPTAGEFRAFNKMCTHQGCPVSSVEDGQIHCRCHGAAFSIEDGSVTNPPATEPLRAASATVNGDYVEISG
ncbi:MAG: Rieske (2Fe-2S) protein [Propionibacteriaceae bacterium]|nr:Rieske (2Fe-2S) protein [Propionibacteriaceae bacterium]